MKINENKRVLWTVHALLREVPSCPEANAGLSDCCGAQVSGTSAESHGPRGAALTERVSMARGGWDVLLSVLYLGGDGWMGWGRTMEAMGREGEIHTMVSQNRAVLCGMVWGGGGGGDLNFIVAEKSRFAVFVCWDFLNHAWLYVIMAMK